MIQSVWFFIQLVIGIHLISPIILYLLYLLVHRKQKAPGNIAGHKEADYGIIVTAYGQTGTLPAVIDSILRLNYRNYLVYVVADNCDAGSLDFGDERVTVLSPEQVLASNTRSHFYAIERFNRAHDRLTIIDSDNLVHPDYLNALNRWFSKGYEAVQGVREPKNLDTTYACLDAARDLYYHFYDGKLLFGAGSSATLAGSGMAFTTDLYKTCLQHRDITGAGFDKILQYEIVRRGLRIAFAEDAIVYDEKTSRSGQLVQQRARWINTWFRYFGFGFKLLASGVKNLNFNQLQFGFTLLRPPLFLFVSLSVLFTLINGFYHLESLLVWLTAILMFVLAFFIALWSSRTDPKIYKSLWRIPQFVSLQMISLLNAKRANKLSVATKHDVVKRISEVETVNNKP